VRYRLATALGAVLLIVACSTSRNVPKQQTRQQQQRYVPVGSDPEVALDTQTGMLCRTVAVASPGDTRSASLPLCGQPIYVDSSTGEALDPACAVTSRDKKLGFVPDACKSGKTWVLQPSKAK
jgi:hypothetical protein